MGCDIHLYVEKRVKDSWQSADKWTVDKYEKRLTVDFGDSFYHDRNYSLFAILADVRNGSGFAGVKIGEGFIPIHEPRGLPKDACAKVRKESERWDGDGHSHSFFTVQELFDYDWTQHTILIGWVSTFAYWKWKHWKAGNGEMPDEYSGAVSGGGVQHISTGQMDKLLAPYKTEFDRMSFNDVQKRIEHLGLWSHYCQIKVEMPYYKTVRRFWSDTIPRLLRLGKPEDVRIVFWFDN